MIFTTFMFLYLDGITDFIHLFFIFFIYFFAFFFGLFVWSFGMGFFFYEYTLSLDCVKYYRRKGCLPENV